MPGILVKSGISPEDFLSHLANAALQATLNHPENQSLKDYRSAFKTALQGVIRKDMVITDSCGLFTVCQEAELCEPWSKEAIKIFRETSA